MALQVRALRTLMYSFQWESARRYLQTATGLPNKVASRFRKAVEWNVANPLSAGATELTTVARVGRWWTLWPTEDRLRIKGTVHAKCMRVGVFVNDRLVKLVNTVPRHHDPRHRRSFRFNMKADILAALPRKSVIGVGSETGYLNHRDGRITYRNARLGGDGTLFQLLSTTHFLTKKGKLLRRLDQDECWKEAAVVAYTRFRSYFETCFGYKPFLICGTLLGYHREADFIAHDDDMDVAYFSSYTTPQGIKRELRAIVFRMLRDGYDIKLARKAGFFKPRVNDLWFDVFPMWSDQGCLWMMNTTRQRAGTEVILPLRTGSFRGVEVYVPQNVERYIELEYGSNWRIPDPAYRPVAEPGTPDYLSGSCMTLEEVKELYEEVKRLAEEQHGVGRLSIAELDINALT